MRRMQELGVVYTVNIVNRFLEILSLLHFVGAGWFSFACQLDPYLTHFCYRIALTMSMSCAVIAVEEKAQLTLLFIIK